MLFWISIFCLLNMRCCCLLTQVLLEFRMVFILKFVAWARRSCRLRKYTNGGVWHICGRIALVDSLTHFLMLLNPVLIEADFDLSLVIVVIRAICFFRGNFASLIATISFVNFLYSVWEGIVSALTHLGPLVWYWDEFHFWWTLCLRLVLNWCMIHFRQIWKILTRIAFNNILSDGRGERHVQPINRVGHC